MEKQMKPKHRHELKTNELAEWLMNFPQWAKQNLTTIIYISVLIAVVAGLYIWKVYSRNIASVQKQLRFTALLSRLSQNKMEILRAREQGVDFSYVLLRPADNLETFAQNTKDDTIAALALIKRAEALRTELHYRQRAVDKQVLTRQMNLAKDSYNKALSRLTYPGARAAVNPSLTAIAKFGLGLCEEELGNFDHAIQIYRDIVANQDFKPTTAAVQAKLRLQTMADYRKTVVFTPPPKPLTPKPIQPEILLKPFDVNLVPQMPKIEIKPLDANLLQTKPKPTDTNLPSQ
jgi:tetratricopeptide (TPR) repeat protein